jgi:deoxyadenosine/deoxycytidine kinase
MFKPRVVTVFIDGLPGCGKSTILEAFQRRTHPYESLILPETFTPAEIKRYYDDPHVYTSSFQFKAVSDRHKQLHIILQGRNSADPTMVVLCERSFETNRMFAEMKKDFFGGSDRFHAYMEYTDAAMDILNRVTSMYFYICLPEDKALERISKRSRPGEKESIDRRYLEVLKEKHDQIYRKVPNGHRLSGDRPTEEIVSEIEAMITEQINREIREQAKEPMVAN